MSRLLALFAALLLCVATPTAAQDGDLARREALARQYLTLSFGDGFAEIIGDMLESEVSKDKTLQNEQTAWLAAYMPNMMDRMMRDVIEVMIPVYADKFTADELEALVTFFSSPLGQSILRKELEIQLGENAAMQAIMMRYYTEMFEKYCAEFSCPDGVDGGLSGLK